MALPALEGRKPMLTWTIFLPVMTAFDVLLCSAITSTWMVCPGTALEGPRTKSERPGRRVAGISEVEQAVMSIDVWHGVPGWGY